MFDSRPGLPGYGAGVGEVSGDDGELLERLLDAVDAPGPQLRAVATTLLIRAVAAGDGSALLEDLVASDDAGAMMDPAEAAAAGLRLRSGLEAAVAAWSAEAGEAAAVAALYEHLGTQARRWAARAVDDADTRRRAERLLAWAERPGQLEAAQRRGLFAGMGPEDLRRMAARQAATPATPEVAVALWAAVEAWLAALDDAVGPAVVEAWRSARGERP